MTEKLNLYTLPLTGIRLIEASAGTGKTWTIAGLYVRLILEEAVPVEQLLVVTYTRAATAELRDRLRKRLALLLAAFEEGGSEDDFCRDFVARFAEGRELAIARLTRAVAAFDEAAIYTIHGFCQRVLAEAAFEAGSDFDPELVADLDDLLHAAAADCWRREMHAADPLWVAYLLSQKESPAAWAKRVQPHLGKPYLHYPESEVSDLAGVAADWRRARLGLQSALAEHGAAALQELLDHPKLNGRTYKKDNIPGWFEELHELAVADPMPAGGGKALEKLTATALAAGVTKGGIPPENPLFCEVEAAATALEALKQSLQARLAALNHWLVREIDAELAKRKVEQGVDGFDDLLTRLAAALQGPGAAALQAAVRQRYRVALIDEFQDTDPVQWDVFRSLFADGGLPLVLVGDPKQAIYRFRGADLFTYLKAGRQAEQKYVLDTNYRSVPPLIDGINALFARQSNAFIEEIDYEPVGARGKLALVSVENPAPIQFRMLPAQVAEKGEKPWGKTEAAQAVIAATAAEIVQLLAGAELEGDGARRRLQPGDIAVLANTHTEAAAMEAALAAIHVPAVRQTRESVFASDEAGDWLRVLVAMANPRDEAAIRAALTSLCMGYGAAELVVLEQDDAGWESILQAFARWHELWQTRGFVVMFRAWLDAAGPDGLTVAPRLLALPGGERRLTNLQHLAELMQTASRTQHGMAALMAWYEKRLADPGAEGDAALLRLPSDAERVKIVTIHASKGLEYPVVFCPWLWNGRLLQQGEKAARCHDEEGRVWLDFGSPDHDERMERYRQETLAEKLRLLYVALTRAKSRLVIHWGLIDRAGESAKGEEGLHTSALAWLLHGSGSVGGLRQRLSSMTSADLLADLKTLIAAAPGSVAVTMLEADAEIGRSPFDEGGGDEQPASGFSPPQLSCAQFHRTLHSAWRLSSFSRLTSGRERETERPDHDARAAAPQPVESARTVFTFPQGEVPANVAGTCLHAIMEDWAIAPAGLGVAGLVERQLVRHGIGVHWQPVVAQMLETTLAAPLDGGDLRLCGLPTAARRAELEFTFPLHAARMNELPALLARFGQPAAFVEAARHLDADIMAGFMKGFVDLVFQYEGRYYLLDWKSNWLGPSFADYAAPQLEAAMAQHHYYLQALIYTLALDRYLARRVRGYDYDTHFGGSYYLFLRGMQPDSSATGVWFGRAQRGLIAEMGLLLCGGVLQSN
ncbi:DNA helicase/exodeoxyribonuclease V, beta subunit [Formivibrio citricus]|uniref:RecBCD enzyme subunit RecB n=1 Tax=Formivibrio citricus TaxID=83765 RepID=A0A1I4V275_9NEIS|nr:exodeoxyribonuclease V subunit beta [Formivibrio citricus]SFM95080.1 DNA helicase/exodeoxyribonuclease V, beta subunit [Formivibrio citricus]